LQKGKRSLVGQASVCGAVKILEDNMSSDQAHKEIAVKQAVQRLIDDYSTAQDAAERIVWEFTNALGWSLPEPGVVSAMKLAWMFLKDSDWQRAESHFMNVLKATPEHALAWVGLMCVDLKLTSEEKIADLADTTLITNHKHYKKLIQFADNATRTRLTKYIKAIEDRVRTKQKEEQRKQEEALNRLNQEEAKKRKEEQRKAEEIRRKREEETRRKEAEEKIKREEAQRKAEEERRRREDEARRKEAEDRKKREEAQRKAEWKLIIIAVILVVGLPPVGILVKLNVSEPSTFQLNAESQAAVLTRDNAVIGNIYTFANMDWRVLDVQENKALLLSEYIIESRIYNSGGNTTWPYCELRDYLNGAFLKTFDAQDVERIANTHIVTQNNPWYGTFAGGGANDKIFLLSIEETIKYFDDGEDVLKRRPANVDSISDQFDSARKAYNESGEASLWWLRSSGSRVNDVAFVNADGAISISGRVVNIQGGVRPALWLNLS
jgi:hypothetical protein